MPPSNSNSLSGFAEDSPACINVSDIRSNFYREELLKHLWCLEKQREYYSESAIDDVAAGLGRLMSKVDRLSARENGDELVSRLLLNIDRVTRLSAWSDAKKLH